MQEREIYADKPKKKIEQLEKENEAFKRRKEESEQKVKNLEAEIHRVTDEKDEVIETTIKTKDKEIQREKDATNYYKRTLALRNVSRHRGASSCDW